MKDELSDGDKHINDGSDGDDDDEDDQEPKSTQSPSSTGCGCHQTTSLSPPGHHLAPPGVYPAPLARTGPGDPAKKYCVEILHMV